MSFADYYLNDLIYYREITQKEKNKIENDLFIKKNYDNNNDIHITKQTKKKFKSLKNIKKVKNDKTFYIVNREVYYN